MPGSGNTTVPGVDDEAPSRAAGPRFVPALVLCWSAVEPDRVGEVALFDAQRSSEWILGRELLPVDDPAAPVRFVQQRPGANRHGGTLGGATLSRRQLDIRVTESGLDITNIGGAVLTVNGAEVAPKVAHSLQPGAVVGLRAHSTYLLTIRPTTLPASASALALHPFGHPDADGMVGESPVSWALRADVAAAVRIGKPILILGQTGTGKELVARAIHRLSGRRGAFNAFNVANLAMSLSASTLFGNARNYPNPDTPERPGIFGDAEGGTLFLDELGELPVEAQAQLLRALEGEYTRLGESRPRHHDVLIVAATNRDPSMLKHDILPRFGARVHVPALAERMEDLPLLARALIVSKDRMSLELAAPFVQPAEPGEYPRASVASRLIVAMLRRTYAGNVRDVDIFLNAAMTECKTPLLNPPEENAAFRVPPTMPPPGNGGSSDTPKHEHRPDRSRLTEAVVRNALRETHWNVAAAARLLSVSRDALIRRMDKLEIEKL